MHMCWHSPSQIGYDVGKLHVMKILPNTTALVVLRRFLNIAFEDRNPDELCIVFVPSSHLFTIISQYYAITAAGVASRNVLLEPHETLNEYIDCCHLGFFHVRAAVLTKLLPSGEIDPAEFDTFFEIKACSAQLRVQC